MTTSYTPFSCTITAITQDVQALVTTDVTHNFIIGNTIRFYIPPEYKMTQLDQLKALVVQVTSDTLTVNIDTRNFTAFSVPSPAAEIAQVVPVGDINTGFSSTGNNVVITPNFTGFGATGNTVPDPITIPGAYSAPLT